jgi:hypothetical protein
MDERPTDAGERPEPRSPEVETPVAPKPAVPPEVFMPPSTGTEAWRSGSGCGPRTRVYLLGLAAVILIAVLFAGLSVLRRGVWASLEQGRRAVIQKLPPDLPAGERERTMRNLERFRSLLDRVDDPYPLMGEFMSRVRAAFEDGRLEKHEVEELNLFLEGAIEEAGGPALQLGFRISNFEFRISNFHPPPHL